MEPIAEIPNETNEVSVEKKSSKKKVFLIAGAVVGVLVIAAAAFLGGRLLNPATTGGPAMLLPGDSGGGMINSSAISFEMIPAPELPVSAPIVNGTFAERQDNTIYVQTFSMDTGGSGGGVVIMGVSEGGSSGDPMVSGPNNSGPKVEVVVSNDTVIYKDVTELAPLSGEEAVKVQQAVEAGSLDELTSQTMITVWGRKVGDRVIAEVILYSSPMMIEMP